MAYYATDIDGNSHDYRCDLHVFAKKAQRDAWIARSASRIELSAGEAQDMAINAPKVWLRDSAKAPKWLLNESKYCYWRKSRAEGIGTLLKRPKTRAYYLH